MILILATESLQISFEIEDICFKTKIVYNVLFYIILFVGVESKHTILLQYYEYTRTDQMYLIVLLLNYMKNYLYYSNVTLLLLKR